MFTNRGNAWKFCILGKNVSPLFCALLSSRGFVLFASGILNDCCRGFRLKTSPPFQASIFRFFRGYFWFGPFERLKPLGVRFALIVPFVPKVFWFGPFQRSKPLDVRFDKYAKFGDSACFANLLSYAACRCWPKLAIWAA